MSIDLRKISSGKVACGFLHEGGTIYMSWQSAVKVDDTTYLLEVEEVVEFVYYFLKEEVDILTSDHFHCDTLTYSLKFKHPDDIAGIEDTFRRFMAQLMTCISWSVCSGCSKSSFIFINPTDNQYVWDRALRCCCEDGVDVDLTSGL